MITDPTKVLNHCPFCGGQNLVVGTFFSVSVACRDCGAHGPEVAIPPNQYDHERDEKARGCLIHIAQELWDARVERRMAPSGVMTCPWCGAEGRLLSGREADAPVFESVYKCSICRAQGPTMTSGSERASIKLALAAWNGEMVEE